MISPSILTRSSMTVFLRITKESLERKGSIEPMLIVRDASGTWATVPLSLPETYAQKRLLFMHLGERIRDANGPFTEAVMLLEGWFVNAREAPGALDVRPSQHPSRQEAIVLTGRNADNTRQSSVVQPFTRDAQDKPVWSAIPVAQYNMPVEAGTRTEGLLDFLFACQDET